MSKSTTTARIRIVQLSAAAIAAIAAGSSYGHQAQLLHSWGVGLYSYAVPLTVDLLAIVSTVARHTPGLDRSGRRAATSVLCLAGAASVAANLVAGATIGARVANVWCVIAYLAAEYLLAKVKGTTAVPAPAVEVHPVAAVTSPSLPEAPVSPAPAGAARQRLGAFGLPRPEFGAPRMPVLSQPEPVN